MRDARCGIRDTNEVMEWWSNGVMGYCRSGPEHPNTRTPEHRNTYPASHIAMRHLVARTSELPPGARKIVEVAGRSIGIFNVHGRYVAVLNVCPHEQAPVCRGRVGGTTLPSGPGEYCWGRAGEILACPWHGWEFDL